MQRKYNWQSFSHFVHYKLASSYTIQPITLTNYEPLLIGPKEQILMKFESKNRYFFFYKMQSKIYSLKYLPFCWHQWINPTQANRNSEQALQSAKVFLLKNKQEFSFWWLPTITLMQQVTLAIKHCGPLFSTWAGNIEPFTVMLCNWQYLL